MKTKVVPTKSAPVQDKNVCPLPLIPETDPNVDTKDSTKFGTFKLLTDPTDNDSTKYSFTMRYTDGTQGLRATIKWVMDVDKVITGLGVADAAAKIPLIQQLCSGVAQTAFDAAREQSRDARHEVLMEAAVNALPVVNGETAAQKAVRVQNARNGVPAPAFGDADIQAGMQAIISQVAPYKVLEKQRRFMRRKMRKPADMMTRQYVTYFNRINLEELPCLPPFGDNQSLPNDEVKDIIVYGLPRSWLKEMDKHDFDPYNDTLKNLLGFCERMEASEDHDASGNTKPSGGKSSKKARTQSGANHSGDKWCEYHETNTHNTSECETLKKLKASRGNTSRENTARALTNNRSPNKTWKRNAGDGKKFTRKELSAIATKAIKEAMKKKKAELNVASKRKIKDDKQSLSSESSDSATSVFSNRAKEEAAMAEIDAELAAFDFSDKEDGEVSC